MCPSLSCCTEDLKEAVLPLVCTECMRIQWPGLIILWHDLLPGPSVDALEQHYCTSLLATLGSSPCG